MGSNEQDVANVLEQIMDRLDGIEGRLDATTPPTLTEEREQRTARKKHLREHPEDQPGYIAHGSPEHAAFLLIQEWPNAKEAQEHGFNVTFRSRKTGKLWSLMDEMSRYVDKHDPEKSARYDLMGKVSSLDSGTPKPPPDAPERFLSGLEGSFVPVVPGGGYS